MLNAMENDKKGKKLGQPPAHEILGCVTSFSDGKGDFYYTLDNHMYRDGPVHLAMLQHLATNGNIS